MWLDSNIVDMSIAFRSQTRLTDAKVVGTMRHVIECPLMPHTYSETRRSSSPRD